MSEYKTVSNGFKCNILREGEIRAVVNVTLLDGSKWVKEVIAIRGQPLYTYHNDSKVCLEHVAGREFREVVYSKMKDIASKPKWKFINGKAVLS